MADLRAAIGDGRLPEVAAALRAGASPRRYFVYWLMKLRS